MKEPRALLLPPSLALAPAPIQPGLQGTISIWLRSVLVSATSSWVKLLTTGRNFKTPGSRQKLSPSPLLPSSPLSPLSLSLYSL